MRPTTRILWWTTPQPGRRRRPGGFTIVEALIGVLILTASIGGLAILTSRQMTKTSDTDVLDRVENEVARDLGWLKAYAKYWRMTSGPYNLTCSQVDLGSSCDAFIVSTTSSEYDPDPNANTCPNPTGLPVVSNTALANAFVSAAASVTLNPARPFAIAVGDTTLVSGGNSDSGRPRLPSGTSLVRNISLGNKLIYVSYSLTGANAASYQFRREVALHPEAASWCP